MVRDVIPVLGQSADRVNLRTEVTQAANRCSAPNWDGNNAVAVSPATVDVASRFIDSFPADVPLPTVIPEPDGQLNFEWYREPRKLLSVSVGTNGTLYWAALIGSEDPRGSIQCGSVSPDVAVLDQPGLRMIDPQNVPPVRCLRAVCGVVLTLLSHVTGGRSSC